MLSGDRDQAIRSLRRGCLLGCLCLPLAGIAQAPPPGTPGVGEPAIPPPAVPEDQAADRWLEAVRAQRQAWEERRRATQDAMDARRRQHDAHQEARQQEHQRRREALLDHIERDREHFLNQGPWQISPPPPNPPSPPNPANPGHPPAPETSGPVAPGGEVPLAYPPLPGWNNRWYYQGY